MQQAKLLLATYSLGIAGLQSAKSIAVAIPQKGILLVICLNANIMSDEIFHADCYIRVIALLDILDLNFIFQNSIK